MATKKKAPPFKNGSQTKSLKRPRMKVNQTTVKKATKK